MIGLISVLLIGSAVAQGLVIRNLEGVRQIESATRAYLIAEGGIEDAIYELSAHDAGYETEDLLPGHPGQTAIETAGVRAWINEEKVRSQWTIRSHLKSGAPSGRLHANEQLVLSLFNDEGDQATQRIATLDVSGEWRITFRIPESATSHPDFQRLFINNDDDELTNEDTDTDTRGGCPKNPVGDSDCDGRANEDNESDVVIYWKLYDDAGNVLTPLPGCLIPGEERSEICESNFGLAFQTTLDQDAVGEDQNRVRRSISDFITNVINTVGSETKLRMELFVVSDLEDATDPFSPIPIPYLEYEITYDTDLLLPDPVFTLQADGFDRDFKQSVRAEVKPRTLVPLFDFTILQQE